MQRLLKVFRPSILCVLVTLSFVFANKALAKGVLVSGHAQSDTPTNPLATIGALVLTAVLGFVSAVLLEYYKSSKEKKKRLSYSLSTNPRVEVVKVTPSDNNIKYEADIALADFVLENTGDKVLRGQQIRLKAPDGTKILDVRYSPEPEREMELTKKTDGLGVNEVVFTIGYLKPKQKIGFHLLIDNPNKSPLVLSPFHKTTSNDDEDVMFESDLRSFVEDDRDIIQRFLTLALIFIIVPAPFDFPIVAEFGYLAIGKIGLQLSLANIIRAFLLLFVVGEIEPFSKAVVHLTLKNRPE